MEPLPEFTIPTPEQCEALLAELETRRRVLLFIQRQHRAAAAGEKAEEATEDT